MHQISHANFQAEALNALQNLTDLLSHRSALRQDVIGWDDMIVLAMSNPDTEYTVVHRCNEFGVEERLEIQVGDVPRMRLPITG